MIPEQSGNSYAPFLKCAELKGTIVTIKTEFAPPENPKIQSPIIGDVTMEDGSDYTLGLNWSTLRGLQKVYGADTADWIGKKIEFFGMKKLGKGNGYLWERLNKMNPTITEFFCYCGLPIYQDDNKMYCKKHGKNYKEPHKKERIGKYSGKSNSPYAYNEY